VYLWVDISEGERMDGIFEKNAAKKPGKPRETWQKTEE
jgi:hypothetical protein